MMSRRFSICSAAITLDCDYGWYSDPLKCPNKFKYERAEVVVGGKNAFLVTFQDEKPGADFPFTAAIHIPNITGDGKIKLTLFARCRNVQAQQVAKTIFQTLTFP